MGELQLLLSDLEALRNDIPPQFSAITDHQHLQLDMLGKGMQFIREADKRMPTKPLSPARARGNGARVMTSVSVPVHVDVVLIGFEARSLDMINDEWFQTLNVIDTVQATLGKRSYPVSGGAPTIEYKFRLVHVSFHVQKAFHLFIQKYIRRVSPAVSSGQYISSQDMEPVIESLAQTIYGPGGSDGVAATLFILNHVGTYTDPASGPYKLDYGYKSGYSTSDLKLLADDRKVIDECFKIAASVKALTKLDLEATPVPPKATGEGSVGDRAAVLDAVHATRLWALSMKESLGSEDLTLSQRALKVLLKVYPEESGGHWRKLALARDIIAVFSGLVEDYGPEEKPHCTSQSWFTRERIVWADLSASGAKPLVAAIDSKTMFTVPLPVPVELASDPGAQLEELVQDVPTANKKIHAGLRMLFAYFKQLKSVATQLKCDISIIDEAAGARSEDTSNPSWKTALEHVGNTVLNAPNHHSAICSHLLVRLGLVKHMLSAQEDLRDILTKLEPEMSTEGEPMLNDIVLFERRMQLEMFRVIKADLVHHNNELHESRSYILSSEVESTVLHRYMGQLSSLIINLAVQAVAPPLTISTYESSEMGLANDVQSSSEEDAQLLASAYYNKDSLLRTTEGFLKAPQSVESFSLYELSEEYIEISDSTSIKMNNSIIKWMSKRYESFESKNEFRGHLLPLFVPEKIEISVFFVVLQQSYKPIGVDGLDATLLLSELQRFKLSSQRLAITMHTNNINGEDRLMRALMACRRSVHKTDGHTQNHVYLDPWCLWGHVRDEEETKRKIEISKSIQRLPIFIFSVDFPNPLYLGREYATSVSVVEAVLVIQNSQREIEMGMYCGTSAATFDGRNPLAPLLMSVGSSITGLTHSNAGTRQASAASVHLCGQSPVFSGVDVSRPSFSDLDMDSSLRNKLLRTLASSEWLIRQKWEATLLSSHEWAIAVNHHTGHHNESALLEQFRSKYEDSVPQELMKIRKEAVSFITQMDWLRASRASNAFLSGALSLQASAFKYSLIYDDSVEPFFNHKSERKLIKSKFLNPDIMATANNNRNFNICCQCLAGVVSACFTYFLAGIVWKCSMASAKF